jgi:dienelactone hydrolase
MDAVTTETTIPTGGVRLAADLVMPAEPVGTVLFAHGSGSSRHSPRNRAVAHALNRSALSTILVDLLTPEEERLDDQTGELRFNIGLLAERLIGIVDWLRAEQPTGALPIGLFGASTGAAAALVAAATRPEEVLAVVSRGGRPDLAGFDQLARVRAATLLLVGECDEQVLDLNRQALTGLGGRAELRVVPGATHLFPEPGALEQVAHEASGWFVQYLSGRAAQQPEQVAQQSGQVAHPSARTARH